MPTCAICAKTFEHEFKFNLNQFHHKDPSKDEYEKLSFDIVICSKYCISTFVQRQVSNPEHRNDTVIVHYAFPLGFCDKCGHGTHPTEFCQQLNDYAPEILDFHERHMAGQGSMVALTGGLVDVYLGAGWMLGVRGIRYEAKCIQMVKDLKERIPLAVVWNNWDELDKFLPSIALDGTEHLECKDIFTDISILPSKKPEKIEGQYQDRHFYVFQVVTKVGCTRKLFFPFQLAMENCWFPAEPTRHTRFRRLFYGNLKSEIQMMQDHAWTEQEADRYLSLDEEEKDCYDDFIEGMKILETKTNVMDELHTSLKEIESKMAQHVFVGEAPELKRLDDGDNVLTEEDKEFLVDKGFDPAVIDDLFLKQMEQIGLEGDIECKEDNDDWSRTANSPESIPEECEACGC